MWQQRQPLRVAIKEENVTDHVRWVPSIVANCSQAVCSSHLIYSTSCGWEKSEVLNYYIFCIMNAVNNNSEKAVVTMSGHVPV